MDQDDELDDLIVAVLGTGAAGAAGGAGAIRLAARRSGTGLFERLVHLSGQREATVAARAAAWAGLAFRADIPDDGGAGAPPLVRIDRLAETRILRGLDDGRPVLFAAANADCLARLRPRLTGEPHLADKLRIVPPSALRAALAQRHQQQLLHEARSRLARRWPAASADIDLSLRARQAFVAGIALVVVLVAIAPFVLQALLLPLVAIVLVVPALMRMLAAVTAPAQPPLAALEPLADDALPVYSVLLPLRDEAQMVPQLARAMRALDYPPDKLDIKFVVEARSAATIAAARAELFDPRFELLPVPDGAPRTKPKAMNYALPFLRGRHVVVYDAEDIPDPDQLRLSASWFAAHPELDCLQAELVIDNADETWLAALFAGEYAGLFGLMVPALSRWRLPMPLGGTSNHFSVQALRELGGWDAFNVTEDADLGVRMARLRYRAGVLPSRTREEAPLRLPAWMAQRTRWMKGWMQTFIVHNRAPRQLLADLGWRAFLGFEIYVGSQIVSPLLHTVFIAMILTRLAMATAGLGYAIDAWTFVYVAIMVLGYGGALTLTFYGLAHLRRRHLVAVQWLLPLYWVLHCLATLRAAQELLTRPHFWAKTRHGRTRIRRIAAVETRQNPVVIPP